ncbi:MAG: beta-lactamase family protein [bacterium]|nr:beta-lactamase family protein [bacterium]
MKTFFKFLYILLFCFFLIGCNPTAIVDNGEGNNNNGNNTGGNTNERLEALREFINSIMDRDHIPGLAACIIKNSEVVFAEGFGFANIERQIKVTPDTLFMLASVSKTITAVAAMQALEKGGIAMDTDINNYLSFEVRNPSFKGRAITLKQLLSHTSSIIDNGAVMDDYYVYGADTTVTLGEFLYDYLDENGREYDEDRNYSGFAPGTGYEYTNIGNALVGLLVEVVMNMPFETFCSQNIFQPLSMNETGWHLEGLNRDNIAVPYLYRSGSFRAQQHYTFPDYPNGGLRTSVSQLARFLMMFIDYGTYDGVQLLTPESVTAMREVHFPSLDPNQALTWAYWTLSGMRLLGHGGGETGVTTEMFFRPDDGVGVIVLTNGDDLTLDEILKRLFEEAEYF